MMPGLTTNTPNRDQLTISGGFAYDNVFLVDGVDVNDNLLGSMNDLYIEDAIGEVQVLTSANHWPNTRPVLGGSSTLLTKSGSNMFGGSYRTTLTRPSWSSETPFERSNNIERGKPMLASFLYLNNKLSTFGEFTAGGPLAVRIAFGFCCRPVRELIDVRHDARDRGALHEEQRQQAVRGQADGPSGPGPHAARAASSTTTCNARTALSFSIDKAPAPISSPSAPNRLGVVNYNAALNQRTPPSAQDLAEGLEDRRSRWHIDRHHHLPLPDPHRTQYQYNAPYFYVSYSEQRNIRQLTASLTYFGSTRSFGSHAGKAASSFIDTPRGGERPELDRIRVPRRHRDGGRRPSTRRRRPPGVTRVQRWIPHRGAETLHETTNSAYTRIGGSCPTAADAESRGMRFEYAGGVKRRRRGRNRRASGASCHGSEQPTASPATARPCCRRRSRTLGEQTRRSSRAIPTSAIQIATRSSLMWVPRARGVRSLRGSIPEQLRRRRPRAHSRL